MSGRAEIVHQLAKTLGYRHPVVWATDAGLAADYAGNQWTLDVFGVDPDEEEQVLKRIYPRLTETRQALGFRPLPVFHSQRDTNEHYAQIVSDAGHMRLRDDVERNLRAVFPWGLEIEGWRTEANAVHEGFDLPILLDASSESGRRVVILKFPDWLPDRASVEDHGEGTISFACRSAASLRDALSHFANIVRQYSTTFVPHTSPTMDVPTVVEVFDSAHPERYYGSGNHEEAAA